MSADKLLQPEGGKITEERIFKNKILQPQVYGGLTTVPVDTLHFKLLSTFRIEKKKNYSIHYYDA